MNFRKRMLPVSPEQCFSLSDEGFFTWCGSVAKGDDGSFYLYFSFWPHEAGFDGWVTESKIGYAVSKNPTGPFTFKGIALSGAGGAAWDRDCVHNPALIRWQGKYFLYYMGNYGDGRYWDHRNHQRIGCAWAEKPEGPFHRLDHPVLDVTPGTHDGLMTSNPTPCIGPDGRIFLMYKAVSEDGELPKGGPVVCGMATAENPLGPFVKEPHPIFTNPEDPWSVEDPFMWYESGRFYALAKDFQGYFTHSEKGAVALFESEDGLNWHPSDTPLAFKRELEFTDGRRIPLQNMERPQMWLDENGRPRVLCCACAYTDDTAHERAFNVQIPIKEADR